MSNTMKALVLEAQWEPKSDYNITAKENESRKATNANHVWKNPQLLFSDMTVPNITGQEVLIAVKACGICGSDTHCYEKDDEGYMRFSGSVRAPVVLGHEFAGKVVEVGNDVTTLKKDDIVSAESIMWCGICSCCRSGSFNQCENMKMVGFSAPGAFTRYVAVNEKFCWKLNGLKECYDDDESMYEVGAMLEPLGCAYNALFVQGGGCFPGAFVAIHGAGPIGLACVMLAKAAGAANIIVLEKYEERLLLAQALGANHFAIPNHLRDKGSSPDEFIREVTGGAGADLQVEAAGAASVTIPEINKSLAANGRVVFLGREDSRAGVEFDPLVSQANQIIGVRGQAGYGIYPHVIRLIAANVIDPRQMVTARFQFDNVIDAFERSLLRKDGKIMIHFS